MKPKSRKILFIILIIFFLLVGLKVLISSYNLSLNTPWGQINTSSGNINIFIPQNNNTILHIHNFEKPVIIENTSSQPTKSPSLQIAPTSPVRSEPISNQKQINSKLLGLTFNTPEGVESIYNISPDKTRERIEYKKGYRMTIDIGKVPGLPCRETTTPSYGADTVLLAGKIELIFPYDDWDGRKGWIKTTAIKYFKDENICLEIYREKNGEVEKIFDQILTSARFN